LAPRIAHPCSICWLLSCLPLLLLAPSLRGQTLFEDRFSDNRHGWPVMESRAQTTWFGDSTYVIQIRSQARNFAFLQPVVLPPEADFDLETALWQEKGDKNMGLGLVWGAQADERDLFAFLVSTNGHYTLLRKERHAYHFIKPWTESSRVHGPKAWNVLRVSRRGDRISFFLNDEIVYTYAADPWRGNHIGVLLHGSMKVEVKYLHMWIPDPAEPDREARERPPHIPGELSAPGGGGG